MTIVTSQDTRNAAWASDTSSFGRRMLAKMGWKEGNGLGKEQQGQTTHLRAVRRQESLGIGADTDAHGEKGWSETSQNFHGVLASLKAVHGSDSSSDNDSMREEKKEKKKHRGKREKDDARRKRKKRLESKKSGLILAQNKVNAGHAKKMRDSKDLAIKSAADMAAVFGLKVDEFEQKQKHYGVNTLSSDVKEGTGSYREVTGRVETAGTVKQLSTSEDPSVIPLLYLNGRSDDSETPEFPSESTISDKDDEEKEGEKVDGGRRDRKKGSRKKASKKEKKRKNTDASNGSSTYEEAEVNASKRKKK